MRPRIIHEVFEEVSIRGYKTVACPACGKTVRRQTTFWQTLSPFNTHGDGRLKTREEIIAELKVERERWWGHLELCSACAAKEAPADV